MYEVMVLGAGSSPSGLSAAIIIAEKKYHLFINGEWRAQLIRTYVTNSI
ncbi:MULTISPECIES: hypothetical protein [Bacillus]|nr:MULTISPECIES: hypothetical protein [Bacillus]MCC9090609.1 hypothetical protein [Bacillus pumilus]MED1749748.1 hypothetical protein [Bacillus zhangzhouensis]UUD43396.1 hypothetical protein NPA43_03630 [Bacillus pumilus]